MTKMTPRQYQNWIKSRGKPGSWDISKCRAADALIRETTLTNFERWSKVNIKEPIVRDLLNTMVRCHFGSVDVDDMLTKLYLYPEWM